MIGWTVDPALSEYKSYLVMGQLDGLLWNLSMVTCGLDAETFIEFELTRLIVGELGYEMVVELVLQVVISGLSRVSPFEEVLNTLKVITLLTMPKSIFMIVHG